ncbi:MAG TPA: hypothetical protein VF104_11130 [Burkholderiales bacterium]
MRRAALVLALAVALAGCPSWVAIGPENASLKENGYEITLPAGWVRMMDETQEVILTREGVMLEQIAVKSVPHKKAFPRLKKPADEKLLPSELAELQIAETKRSSQVESNLDVIQNEPAQIGGRTGFRVRLRFLTPKGIPFEQLLYGVCDQKNYYLLGLQAPGFYYFDAHRADFERMVTSFRFAPG